jgi:hypothetical protein
MTKALLMIDHSMPRNFDDPEMREVEAFITGGLEGVFAIYRLHEHPNIYYFASGDDGNWWRISNGLHVDWLGGIYLSIAEAMLDREGF